MSDDGTHEPDDGADRQRDERTAVETASNLFDDRVHETSRHRDVALKVGGRRRPVNGLPLTFRPLQGYMAPVVLFTPHKEFT